MYKAIEAAYMAFPRVGGGDPYRLNGITEL